VKILLIPAISIDFSPEYIHNRRVNEIEDKAMGTTTHLFWTNEALEQFQAAWNNNEYDKEIIHKYGACGISFSHWRTENAVDADVEKLFDAAASGCNLHLSQVYAGLWRKWAKKGNDAACDYLANAWDCISTAQCKLAKRWGACIEWHVEDVLELR
jgi:hypothetical protein